MAWLVDAELHPRAGATTLAVARDLAVRMDYRLGLVLYDLEGTAARCGVSTATVKRHVRMLRELGALAWQRHGTKRNLRLSGRSYTATATIYAATVPAAYDDAMGHRLDGTGYGARVVGVTDEGRVRAVEAARAKAHPVDNGHVGKPGSRRREPHSSGPRLNALKAEADGRLNYTSRERAARVKPSAPGPGGASSGRAGRSIRKGGSSRSPWQVARDIVIARQVRPLVGWTQCEGLRRLAYALRPLIDCGLDVQDIAAELHSWFLDWRPNRPAGLITAELRRRAVRDAGAPDPCARALGPSTESSRGVVEQRLGGVDRVGGVALVAGEGPQHGGVEGLPRAEVIDLRSAAMFDPGLVIAALENLGERDTRRLYTNRLVDEALLRAFGRGRVTTRPIAGSNVSDTPSGSCAVGRGKRPQGGLEVSPPCG